MASVSKVCERGISAGTRSTSGSNGTDPKLKDKLSETEIMLERWMSHNLNIPKVDYEDVIN